MTQSRHRRIAFLLAQLGTEASTAFEQALTPLGITPSEAGLLRLVGRRPGISQKEASEQLGVGPSRVVAVLDRLEVHQHIDRRRSTTDRRSHEIHLTPDGERLLASIGPVAKTHEASFTHGLSDSEADELADLLAKIAKKRGLSLEVHRNTGFRL